MHYFKHLTMENNYKKISVIFILSALYGAIQVYFFSENFSLINLIFQGFAFLIISLVITLIWSIFRLKKWGFLKVFYYSSILGFILYLLILSFSKFYETKSDSESFTRQENKYKKIVNKENKKPIKKVGEVKREFLNEDNFYENYVYNYAVKFPKNFKLNYGIGEYSNIMAYNGNDGKQISITTGDNGINYSLSNLEANEMIENFKNKHLDFFANKIIEKWEKDGTYQEIKVANKKIVNFYNRKFIRLTFEASRNLNDTYYLYTVTDFITFFKDNNYHFYFESPAPQNESEWDKWNNLILDTMTKVRISSNITQ